MVARTGRNAADVAETRSPVLRRRELGAMLRALRAESEMTVEQVAERLLCSPSKVSRLETGARGASARDIRDLSDLYQVDPAQREHLAQLAKEGRSQGWWQPYGLPYETYVGLETAATSISDFEPGVFPGLLQTPDYARAVHEGAMPKLSPAVIEQRIEVRLVRQAALTRADPAPPRLEAIVDEAVLYRPVGGSEVMSAQISRVIEACELPNVNVQVLPFAAGAHPALDSTFILLEFEDLPAVVYVEGLVGQVYVERPEDVQRYVQVFDRLRAISLNGQKSLDLMRRKLAEYGKT
jgi:transcriptional regulator with XRE-family HTH domain